MRLWLAATLALVSCGAANAADRLLLRHPAMSKTQIVFEYGGELWTVPRAGGTAHVLASGVDLLADPIFSPDGSQIAFSGTYDKNTDVYVVPAAGGQPRRLTYHPDPDVAAGLDAGWQERPVQLPPLQLLRPRSALHRAGDAAAFRPSCRCRAARWARIRPTAATSPMFRVSSGSPSGRATRAASTPRSGSRGCRTPARSGSRTCNSNEGDPMWVGHSIYFLSDRDGPATSIRLRYEQLAR